jgi:hypothetical protein
MLIKTWKQARRLKLKRTSPCGIYTDIIDAGVNYFVLRLEQLGAVTHYSCEGHPSGFYILFAAPIEIAEQIRQCGFFSVELEGKIHSRARPYLWSIRANYETEEHKERALGWAAAAWTTSFGPIEKKHEQRCNA